MMTGLQSSGGVALPSLPALLLRNDARAQIYCRIVECRQRLSELRHNWVIGQTETVIHALELEKEVESLWDLYHRS